MPRTGSRVLVGEWHAVLEVTVGIRLVAWACTLGLSCLSLVAADGLAQAQDRRQTHAVRSHAAPRAGGLRTRGVVIRRARIARPHVRVPIMRRAQRVVRPQRQLRAIRRARRARAPRVITRLPPKAPGLVQRVTRQVTRKAPVNMALVNAGLRRNPGGNKPAHIQHNPKHKAGKAAWMHRHRPFFFKHGGHRWKRQYYTFLVDGLWYWYWYDLEADADPGVVIYSDAVLPDCGLESDECVEPELIAPAILEGRASEEAMARCAERFRSFDKRTGTYVTYQGELRVCPYLE